jgi:hypothetical protein
MTVISSEGRAARAAPTAVNWLASPFLFWGVLALYLAAHIALRLWETPNLGKNDVQEALAAHGWAWGYHPRNPPLHTWLLMASYSVFGVGVLAHVVLKYLLLGAAYLFAYLSGRRLLSTTALAALAAFSLTLLTPFAWTVHTALTHTLLLAVLIFATLWAAVRLTTHRRWLDYILFGAMIGLGFLAKYSYPLFLAPLLVAMLCQAEFRRVLLNPRSLATLATACLVFLPHGLWMLSARFDFVEFLAEKQRSDAPHAYLLDVGLGFGNVVLGAVSFLAPLILLVMIFLRDAPRKAWGHMSSWGRALSLAPIFGVTLLALDVLVLGATQFEERYFMCALLVAPLALFAWLDRPTPATASRTWARFGVAAIVVALLVFAGLSGRALFYNQSCSRCWEEMAVPELVYQVRIASGFQHGTIIADHYNVAGNLSVAFPDARVIAANYVVDEPRQDADGQCLLVWNARNAGDPVPSSVADYLDQRHLRLPAGRPTYVDAPLLRSADRMDRFAYWLLPNADGNCDPRQLVGGGDVTRSF